MLLSYHVPRRWRAWDCRSHSTRCLRALCGCFLPSQTATHVAKHWNEANRQSTNMPRNEIRRNILCTKQKGHLFSCGHVRLLDPLPNRRQASRCCETVTLPPSKWTREIRTRTNFWKGHRHGSKETLERKTKRNCNCGFFFPSAIAHPSHLSSTQGTKPVLWLLIHVKECKI